MMYICLRWMRGHTPDRMSRRERHGSPDRGQKGRCTMKKETSRFEIELSRSNVTPAQFLAYVRHMTDKKGGRYIRSDLDLAYFKAGNDLNFDFTHEDPEVPELLGLHEKSVSRPYEMQTYLRYPSGAVYNEICEFEFDDEKTGHGYYYLINVMVDEQGEDIEEEAEPEKNDAEKRVEAVAQKVEQTKTRSAWDRGVKAYAEELVEELREAVEGGYVDADELSNRRLFERAMLNGAADWKQYSEGGSALCYDCQIAERLCAPWELRKTDGGCKDPNPRESWIDVQSRALTQAARLVLRSAF